MRRLEVATPLKHLYATISHRRRRYRSLTQRKASIAMLVNRIKVAFTAPIEAPAGVLPAEVVDGALLYGDWSFRGGRSTMGVGLHRVLADEFLLLHVNEFRTSSMCPTCHGLVEHPCVPVHPHHAGDGVQEYREVRHLLRCPSVNCKSQW
ncbi:hypothetical protein BC828DRAFT_198878 [Blastocladiella britannica]|nr:hypothetical protein BC828DRAFT_198878 [Blastocladiella britannica]